MFGTDTCTDTCTDACTDELVNFVDERFIQDTMTNVVLAPADPKIPDLHCILQMWTLNPY